MSDSTHGGWAFPVTTGDYVRSEGMTLRDWFAGQALAGITADPNTEIEVGGTVEEFWKGVAQASYNAADAMLEARAKP